MCESEVTDGSEGVLEILCVWLRSHWTAATVAWDDLDPHRKDWPHLALWTAVDLSTVRTVALHLHPQNKERQRQSGKQKLPVACRTARHGRPIEPRARRWQRHEGRRPAVRPELHADWRCLAATAWIATTLAPGSTGASRAKNGSKKASKVSMLS